MKTRWMGRRTAVLVRVTVLALVTLLALAASAWAGPEGFFAQKRASVRRADLCLTWMELTAGRNQFAYYTRNGDWHHTGPLGWAAGYHPGGLWCMYALSGSTWWRDMALRRQAWIGATPIDAESQNIGALFVPSYVRGYRLTGAPELRRRALQVSRAMAVRYDPLVGAMLSRPGDEFNVIIDSLMKSQLLWWSADAGGPAVHDQIATAHALTIARDLVREDGSTWHMAFYDATTGALTRRGRGSASSVDSTWARGQAWAILGFAAAYRETGDPRFLDVARSVSDWYLANVPGDMVPYWDFDAPEIPLAPRDSSSAAIAASGLVDLALVEPEAERSAVYAEAARQTLASLMSPAYSSTGWTTGLLAHGTYSWHMDIVDRGLAYGDAFFLEALLRLRRLAPEAPPLPVSRARATAGNAAAAIDGDVSTRWVARGAQSLDLRLDGLHEVGAIRVALFDGARRAARLNVKVSADGRHWKAAVRTMTSGDWASFETLDFAPLQARWVRISCAGTTLGRVNRIAEVEVYPAL